MIPRHGTHDSDVILALATVGLVGFAIAARQACRPTTPPLQIRLAAVALVGVQHLAWWLRDLVRHSPR